MKVLNSTQTNIHITIPLDYHSHQPLCQLYQKFLHEDVQPDKVKLKVSFFKKLLRPKFEKVMYSILGGVVRELDQVHGAGACG